MYKYGRSYKTQDEYIKRFQNFHNSKKFIDNYNANVYKLNSSAWLGIQETSDWGDDELLGQKGDRLMRAAKRPSQGRSLGESKPAISKIKVLDETNIKKSLDWRAEGAVNQPPEVQGNCGSCWAFTAAGALEGYHYIKNKELLTLSV